MSTVFIYPANNNENQYINIQESAIKKAGHSVTYSLKDFFKIDYFLFNWFETLGGNKKIDYIKKTIKLITIKLFNKKILWVLHNKKPHNKDDKDKFIHLSIRLMKKLLKKSYKIIILCDESKHVLESLCNKESKYISKIYKIPHPNYIGIYPESMIQSQSKQNRKLYILYIGQVNKYKNIDILINAINSINNPNIHLHIAGNCKSNDYKQFLINSNINNNISFDFRFIPDNELISIISNFDIVALPYSYESSLNSGTIFLAFSYKKTVIAPMIGTLKDFKDNSFFYGYDYKDENEHKEVLISTIKNVFNDFEKDNSILEKKGIIAYKTVKENNSIEMISELYKQLL